MFKTLRRSLAVKRRQGWDVTSEGCSGEKGRDEGAVWNGRFPRPKGGGPEAGRLEM